MSEYWKSTASYWCKHCNLYVRDTKLERANHEATAKHQGAVRRALTSLHRDHERDERESERAKREIARLNGVVSGLRHGEHSSGKGAGTVAAERPQQTATQAQRQQQLEQLAGMGVNIPDTLRGDMAMAGEWAVTSTRVIKDAEDDTEESKDGVPIEAKATGVRKRELEKTEEEREEDEAVKGLFKKQRRWGRDSKKMPLEEDAELDALLNVSMTKPIKEESDVPVKEEEDRPTEAMETRPEEARDIKQTADDSSLKGGPLATDTQDEVHPTIQAPAVFFKKRRQRDTRQG